MESRESTPYSSAPASPTPLLSVTTNLDSSEHDEVGANVLLSDCNDEMQWHLPKVAYMQQNVQHTPAKSNTWKSDSYIPVAGDRCNQCSDCKTSSTCAALNDGYQCICCAERKSCLRRFECGKWLVHMKENWRRSLVALNESMKGRHEPQHLEYVEKWNAHFIRLGPPPYHDKVVNEEEVREAGKQGLGKEEQGAGGVKSKVGTRTIEKGRDGDDNEEGGQLQVSHLLKMMANMQAQHNTDMKNLVSKFDIAMQRQEVANKELQGQLRQVQEGTKQITTPSMFSFGAPPHQNVTTGNASAPPEDTHINAPYSPSYVCADSKATGPQHTTPKGEAREGQEYTEGSNAHHAMERLAQALEKTLIAPKQTTRLPHLCMPKLMKTGKDSVTSGNFFSWKKKCLQLIDEHSISESIGVHLLQVEESLPRRMKSSIQNCTSVSACFETLGSMIQPLESLFPKIIQELTAVESCFDNEGQIKTLDTIIQLLLQLEEHFPTKDLDIGQMTATLSAFSGPAQLTQLPALLSEFQAKHISTRQKYTTLLYTHCIKRRTDLYAVTAAISMYRPDQVHHNLMQPQIREAAGRGGGGGGDVEKAKYRGGKKGKPGRCGVCSDEKAIHAFYNCHLVKQAQQNKIKLPAHLCSLCLRPKNICQAAAGKCAVITRPGKPDISLLCEKHTTPPRHYAICRQCKTVESPFSPRVPVLNIQVFNSDEEDDSDVDDGRPGSGESGALEVMTTSNSNVCAEGCLTGGGASKCADEPVQHCNIDGRSKGDTPPCLFLLQKCTASIGNSKFGLIICFDTAAGCSSIRFTNDLEHKFQPDRMKKVQLVTATGYSSHTYPVYDIIVHGAKENIKINCINMQEIPLPRVKDNCFKAIVKSGFDYLPSQEEINNTSYCLLGAGHLRFFPHPLNERLVPKSLKSTFPQIQIFRSVILPDTKLVAGCLTRDKGKAQHMAIAVLPDEEDCESALGGETFGAQNTSHMSESDKQWEVKSDTGAIDYNTMWKAYNDEDVYGDHDIFYSDIDQHCDSHCEEIFWSDPEDSDDEYADTGHSDNLDDSDSESYIENTNTALHFYICTSTNNEDEDLHYEADAEDDDEEKDGDDTIRKTIINNDEENIVINNDEENTVGVDSNAKMCLINDDDDDGDIIHPEFKFFREEKNDQLRTLYKDFLGEYKNAFSDKSNVPIGCDRCDKKIANFTSAKELNAHQLKSLVSFNLNDTKTGGKFTYSRIHLPAIQSLPDGIKQCGARLYRCAMQLDKMHHTRDYLNHTLATDHVNDRTKWLSDIEADAKQGNQVHTVPLTVVRNLKSSTTLLRVCQSANAMYKSICNETCPCKVQQKEGKQEVFNRQGVQSEGLNVCADRYLTGPNEHCKVRLSLNNTINEYPQNLPPIMELALSHRTTMVAAGADIVRFFRQINQSIKCAMLCSSVLYKDNVTALPTFSMSTNGQPNEKHILVPTACAFGIQDLSQAAQACCHQVIDVFTKHLAVAGSRENMCQILEQADIDGRWLLIDNAERNMVESFSKEALKSHVYIDDFCHQINLKVVMKFLQAKLIPIALWTEEKLAETALEFQFKTGCFIILALNFCNFDFKTYDTNSQNGERLNKLINMIRKKEIIPDVIKPSNELVRGEHMVAGVNVPTKHPSEQTLPESSLAPKEYLKQLGVTYFTDGTCGLKCKILKLKGVKNKKSVHLCASIEDFDKWVEEKEAKITRRDLAVILGQFFSQNTGLHFKFATTVLKHVIATSARKEGGWQWTTAVDKGLLFMIRAAVRLYFQCVTTRQIRCQLQFQLDVVHVLIGSSDAGNVMHSTAHHVVQISTVGNTAVHRVQNLATATYLNKVTALSVPYWEAIALAKSVATTCKLFQHLNKQGLLCNVANVLQLSDSAATVCMSKNPPSSLQPKYGHIFSRICLLLMSIGTTPQETIFFFLQDTKKREYGQKFVADVISKVGPNLTEDEIVTGFPKNWKESEEWMHKSILDWKHISKFPENYDGKKLPPDYFQLTDTSVRDMTLSEREKFGSNETAVLTSTVQGCDEEGVLGNSAKCLTRVRMIGQTCIFDKLLLRKFSKLNSPKSAIAILALIKYYFLKLRLITQMKPTEKRIKKAQLIENLTSRRAKAPFLPSCFVRCGLVPTLECGLEHMITKTPFFEQNNLTDHMWPNFEKGKEVKVENIFSELSNSVDTLSFHWTHKHECLLREYICCVLAAKQKVPKDLTNVQYIDVRVGQQGCMTLAVGRMQAKVVESHQQSLGRPTFRCLTSSVFGMSMIRLHHLKAGHNRVKAKLSLLRHGFLIKNIENVFWSAEQSCKECTSRKAMNNAKNTSLYNTISGHALQLSQLCYNPDRQTVCCDGFGPYECLSGKFWGILFYNLHTCMVYTYVIDTLSVEGFNQVMNQLVAHIGSIGLIISDQAPSFMAAANVFQVDAEDNKATAPAGRKPRQPLARLLAKSKISGSNAGISFKIVSGHSGEMLGLAEAFVKCTKRALQAVRFAEKCKDYTFCKVQAIFSTTCQSINTRPVIKMANGHIYSPYDLMCLSLFGGREPEQKLSIMTDEPKIRHQLSQFANVKNEIQEQLFNHYTKHLFISSGFRQRGNFQFMSQYLEEGDLIFYKEDFSKHKSFTKAIRRVAYLDKHRRHAVCYHLVSPEKTFDAEQFTADFNECKSKTDKQKLVSAMLGNFRFNSIDLRKCSFLCKKNAGVNLDECFKRSKRQNIDHPLTNTSAYPLEDNYKTLKEHNTPPSCKIVNLPREAVSLATDKEPWISDPRGIRQDQDDSKDDPIPMTKTRCGRLIKRPTKLGF